MLRFNNGLTSAGAALTDPVAAALGAADGAAAWSRLLATLPSVADQFRSARAVLPFVHAPRIAFRSARVAGPGWALLPSAAGVIDPLLSTGFPLTLLGILRLVDLLERTSAGPERDAALLAYERTTLAELDATERLVAALYATMDDPPLFKRLSLLYFAAASFSETARRLGRPGLAPGFLLCAHPSFGPEVAACAAAAAAAPRVPRGARSRRASTGRSSRSTSPASSIANGGTGIPSSPRICWRRQQSSTPRRQRFSVSWSAAAWCRHRSFNRVSAGRSPASQGVVMSERQVLANQAKILRNQVAILRNQKKLDQVLRNQKRIEANQTRILANQARILAR